MAELATIARPYAEALFQSARADLGATAAWLDPLATLAGDARLQAFAADPKASSRQVYDLLAGLLDQPLPPAGRNFLNTVIDNGRLGALPEIAAQFRQLRNAEGGSSDAVVYSPFPITPTDLESLGASLQKRFGRTLNIRVQTDESLIGGVRVVVGDEVLDTSVKARLEQMKAALTA